jgi:hypothetical protein
MNEQLSKLTLDSADSGAKKTFHMQLERFFQLNGIKLPMIIDNEDQYKDLVKVLMNILLIPPAYEKQFSQLLQHIRKKDVHDEETNTDKTVFFFPYVDFTRWGDKWTRALPPEIKPQPAETASASSPSQETLEEVVLLCEDLNIFLESSATTRFNPLEGLIVLSRLHPIHWSALSQDQMQVVEKAFDRCLNVEAGHAAREQGVELLRKVLAETTDNHEIIKLSKFISNVVNDLGERPELQELIQAKMNLIEGVQRASLAANQKLIREQLIAGLWGSRPEGILASIWIEPAQISQVASTSSSSSSSSSTSPSTAVRTAPILSLRAFKTILEIVKDKDVSDDVKIRLLKNLISWAQYPHYPKLSRHPELVRLAREITSETINQLQKNEDEMLNKLSAGGSLDHIAAALEGRPELLQTAHDLEACLTRFDPEQGMTSSTDSIQAILTDPGSAIDETLKPLIDSKGRLKAPSSSQIKRTAESLNYESKLVFSKLDLSDLCITPYGETFSNIGHHSNQVRAKVSNYLNNQMGSEITGANKGSVLRMLSYFHSLAEASLARGDVNMYVAIAGGLTDIGVTRKLDAYNNSHKSAKMKGAQQRLKDLSANLSSNQSFKKLRDLNTNAYNNNLDSKAPPAVPTVNYIGQDLTFSRDGNTPIKTDNTINEKLYSLELTALTYLSNCLDVVKEELTTEASQKNRTPTR